MSEEAGGLRLDRWLWAARFFKTRSSATQAISGGHVHVNGERVKPARRIRPGDRLDIRRAAVRWEVEVRALRAERRPAPEAATLYAELPESIERREAESARRREAAARRPHGLGRPTKKERREIERQRREEGRAD